MNKYRRSGIAGAGGLTVGGLMVRSGIVGEKTHHFLQEISDRTLTMLGTRQPSSDDIVFLTSSALSGILIRCALPKKNPSNDDTTIL